MHSWLLRKRGSSHFSSMQIASAMKTRLPQTSRALVGAVSTTGTGRCVAIAASRAAAATRARSATAEGLLLAGPKAGLP